MRNKGVDGRGREGVKRGEEGRVEGKGRGRKSP